MLFKDKIIDFMGVRKIALVISLVLLSVSIGAIVTKGLNLGIDFTGGTVMEIGYPAAKNPDEVRTLLADNGYEGIVQHFGSAKDILIRLAPQKGGDSTQDAKAKLSNDVLNVLRSQEPAADMRRIEFVGPQIGEELREQGGMAMLLALFGILLYVTLRFEFRFSVGAVAALIHDVVLTVGFFSLTQIEFDLTVLAAILAIIGYSLNDTIVVFDRQRENFRILRTGTPAEVLNISLNQTLSRTLITSLTTLVVVLALYILGSEVIAAFSIALIVGITVGTYSSIYVASNLLLAMGITKEALMPPEREDNDDLDAIP